MTTEEFIAYIAPIIVDIGSKRGYRIFSTTIAQAIIEGTSGKSVLAAKYHNHFGMKCGSTWVGPSVNLKTKEEYIKGTLSDISANFRTYDNDIEGVKGYYDFISLKRYANLKTAINYKQFAEFLKADNYATSSGYVNTLCKTVEKHNLTRYDMKIEPVDILIAQASMGETGIKGQIAGNQTGKELNVKKYYKHKQGWRAFRHPDPIIQHKIAFAALNAVHNPNIGYDQENRNSLFVAAQKYDFDPGLVKVDVECDCSSLVRVCVAHAGKILPDFNTSNEGNVLKYAGFVELNGVDWKTGKGLVVGDILVTNGKGHTCIVVQA